MAARAHAAGLEVVLCPVVEVRGGEPGAWRGRIDTRAGLAWWQSYEQLVVHDLEEQRRCYAALERALPAMPSVEGAIFWAWLGEGGALDRWYTPRAKPAEAIVRRILASFRSGG